MKTSVSFELSKIVYFLIISVWKILFRITNNRNWLLAPLYIGQSESFYPISMLNTHALISTVYPWKVKQKFQAVFHYKVKRVINFAVKNIAWKCRATCLLELLVRCLFESGTHNFQDFVMVTEFNYNKI